MFAAITSIEISCFLAALFLLKHTHEKVWVLIKWFTFFMLITDILLAVLGRVYHMHNSWLVNLYTLVNFFVVSRLLYKLSPYRKNASFLFSTGAVLFSLCFLYEMMDHSIFEYNKISSIVSDVFLFIMCNRFFYLLLQEDAWIEIHRHAAFWLITGLFMFNLCAIIADVFDDQLANLYLIPGTSLYSLLYLIFSLILYGCWTFSFVCKYRETI